MFTKRPHSINTAYPTAFLILRRELILHLQESFATSSCFWDYASFRHRSQEVYYRMQFKDRLGLFGNGYGI